MAPSLRDRAHAARAAVLAGGLRGAALGELLRSLALDERDMFVDELLAIDSPPADLPLPRGAVPYLPCGVDAILTLVREVPLGPDDVLVDIGSGLGRVLVLAHLLCGVRAHGIELQPHLVARARETAADLGLAQRVTFATGNAAETPLAGTVFFLYAPCNGALLAGVLAQLAEVAQQHSIHVVCCGLELDAVAWLSQAMSHHDVTIYRSHRA